MPGAPRRVKPKIGIGVVTAVCVITLIVLLVVIKTTSAGFDEKDWGKVLGWVGVAFGGAGFASFFSDATGNGEEADSRWTPSETTSLASAAAGVIAGVLAFDVGFDSLNWLAGLAVFAGVGGLTYLLIQQWNKALST